MRKQEQAALALKVDEMEKFKLTLNRHRYIPVDQKLKQSRIMKFYKSTKCHIKQTNVEEQTEYFIFTTKLVKFNIRIQVVGAKSQGVKE